MMASLGFCGFERRRALDGFAVKTTCRRHRFVDPRTGFSSASVAGAVSPTRPCTVPRLTSDDALPRLYAGNVFTDALDGRDAVCCLFSIPCLPSLDGRLLRLSGFCGNGRPACSTPITTPAAWVVDVLRIDDIEWDEIGRFDLLAIDDGAGLFHRLLRHDFQFCMMVTDCVPLRTGQSRWRLPSTPTMNMPSIMLAAFSAPARRRLSQWQKTPGSSCRA